MNTTWCLDLFRCAKFGGNVHLWRFGLEITFVDNSGRRKLPVTSAGFWYFCLRSLIVPSCRGRLPFSILLLKNLIEEFTLSLRIKSTNSFETWLIPFGWVSFFKLSWIVYPLCTKFKTLPLNQSFVLISMVNRFS